MNQVQTVELELIEKDFEQGGIEGSANWFYALGVDEEGTLVIVLPLEDGSYVTSAHNRDENKYGSNYTVVWK